MSDLGFDLGEELGAGGAPTPLLSVVAPAPRVRAFRIIVFTATKTGSWDPTDASTYLRSVECFPPADDSNEREAVIAVSPPPGGAVTVRAAVRTLYADGTESPWRVSSGTDVVDGRSAPWPTQEDVQNWIDLAGSGTRVYYQDHAPLSGMRLGDVWFDTTRYLEDGRWRIRYTPYRWDGAVWVLQEKSLLTASEIAAGAIVADKIGAHEITADKLTIGTISDNLFPNASSEVPPPAGVDVASPSCPLEWAWWWQGDVYNGTACRRVVNTTGATQIRGVRVPCAPGDAFYLEAYCGAQVAGKSGVHMQFLNAAGNLVNAGEVVGYATAVNGWSKASSRGTAGAGAVTAWIYLFAENGVDAWWDAIYARRQVTGPVIKAGSIETDHLAAGSITADKISATGITADRVTVGGVTLANMVKRFTCTVSNGEHQGTIAVNQPDENYICTWGIWSSTNSGAAIPDSAWVVKTYSKSASSVSFDTIVPPGDGNSITFEMCLVRLP